MKIFVGFLAAVIIAAAPGQARAQLADALQAVVHDSVITYHEVNALTEQTADTVIERYRSQPATLEKELNKVRVENLEKQVQNQLILHDFKTAGYSLPQTLLEDLFQERLKAEFGDRATATKSLDARGMTIEKYKQLISDRFIIQQMRLKNISQELIISPHKIEAYYLAHREDFKVPDQVKLRLIVLNKSKDPNAPNANELAREIIRKLKEGASFSEMAAIYSQDRNKGDRGWVEKGVLRKELDQIAFELKPGERSDVIDTEDVCYLMLVEDKRAEHYKTLTEVREQIDKDLLQEERSRLEKQWIDRLKKKTFVRYF
jgi:parvulin-like peptidyl-prolyl isomerase